MIQGTGIDSVAIDRFEQWPSWPHALQRILSEDEIAYCLADPRHAPQRIAVRFAAREALYKAICFVWPDVPVPFLLVCRCTAVVKKINGSVDLCVDWQRLGLGTPGQIRALVSLTHTNEIATALVILEQTGKISQEKDFSVDNRSKSSTIVSTVSQK